MNSFPHRMHVPPDEGAVFSFEEEQQNAGFENPFDVLKSKENKDSNLEKNMNMSTMGHIHKDPRLREKMKPKSYLRTQSQLLDRGGADEMDSRGETMLRLARSLSGGTPVKPHLDDDMSNSDHSDDDSDKDDGMDCEHGQSDPWQLRMSRPRSRAFASKRFSSYSPVSQSLPTERLLATPLQHQEAQNGFLRVVQLQSETPGVDRSDSSDSSVPSTATSPDRSALPYSMVHRKRSFPVPSTLPLKRSRLSGLSSLPGSPLLLSRRGRSQVPHSQLAKSSNLSSPPSPIEMGSSVGSDISPFGMAGAGTPMHGDSPSLSTSPNVAIALALRHDRQERASEHAQMSGIDLEHMSLE